MHGDIFTVIEYDEFGRAYTTSVPSEYQIEDTRPTNFIKDPAAKAYYERVGRWIKMYTKQGKRYYLPRSAYHIDDPIDCYNLESLESKLYDYQYEAIESLIHSKTKGGMVRSGEGSGKTRTMWALTHVLPVPVVIIVPTLTIQKGIVKGFKELGKDIIPISGSKIQIDPKQSYVMHIKTFLIHYDNLNDGKRVYIQDECHKAPQTIINAINLWKTNIYGFTASPIRLNFGIDGFKMLYGTIHETGKESLPIKVFGHSRLRQYTIDYAMECKGDLPSDSYEIYRKMLYGDTQRNKEIVDTAVAAYKKHGTVIVFTDRTEHAKLLYENISKLCQDTFIVIGENSHKDITKTIANLNQFIIVGSIGCCGEGLDIPSLKVGILTFNTSFIKTIRQSAGRTRRYFGDKTHGYYIDFQDIIQIDGGKKYYGGASKRKKIYQELGFSFTML